MIKRLSQQGPFGLWPIGILLAVLLVAVLAPAAIAQGQNGIVVEESSARMDFPLSITFALKVRGPADIVRIALQYRVLHQSLVPMVSERKPDFVPQQEVQASWTWDMRRAPLAPGATLEYWWQMQDAQGGRLETKPATLRFEDSRFSWKEVSEGGLSVYWYQGSDSFARELLQTGLGVRDKLSREMGHALEQARVYVYASVDDMRGTLVYSIGWEGGVTFSSHHLVILSISPGDLAEGKKTLAHELTHVTVGEITFSPYGDLPTWLSEGLASYMEGQMAPWMPGIFEEARSQGRLISVRSLSSPFPVDPGLAYLSYAESYSIVQFLIEGQGWDRMRQLHEVFKEGAEYDEALEKVYGFDLDGLNQGWQANLGERSEEPAVSGFPAPGVGLVVSATGVVILGGIMVFALWRIRRKGGSW